MATYKALVPTDKSKGEFAQVINGIIHLNTLPMLQPNDNKVTIKGLSDYFEEQYPTVFDSKAFNKDCKLITVELIKYD